MIVTPTRSYLHSDTEITALDRARYLELARERKRREIEPALEVLKSCAERTQSESAGPGREFYQQMRELQEFVEFGIKVSDTISSMKHASALQWAMKLLG